MCFLHYILSIKYFAFTKKLLQRLKQNLNKQLQGFSWKMNKHRKKIRVKLSNLLLYSSRLIIKILHYGRVSYTVYKFQHSNQYPLFYSVLIGYICFRYVLSYLLVFDAVIFLCKGILYRILVKTSHLL